MQTLLRRRVLLALVLLATVTLVIRAQAPAPSAPPVPAALSEAPAAFEVASVRLGDPHPAPFMPGDSPWSRFPTNRFYAHNLNLKLIIGLAFGVGGEHIEGAPGWLESENYSIEAKVEGDQKLTYDQIKPLLQNLLAQRLGLKVHHESKLNAGYELVVAKGGPKLKTAERKRKDWFQILPNEIDGWDAPTGTLAGMLASPIGKPVVDKTCLTGSYDITLKYAPLNDPNATSNNPDIFTAVQEQLGLKLVPAKVPVDYLVIDHVDRVPTEN